MSSRAAALIDAIRQVPGTRPGDPTGLCQRRDGPRGPDRTVHRAPCTGIDAEDASTACMNVRDGDLYCDQP